MIWSTIGITKICFIEMLFIMVHVFCIASKIPLTNATKGTQDVQAPRCVLVKIFFILKFCVAPDTFVSGSTSMNNTKIKITKYKLT